MIVSELQYFPPVTFLTTLFKETYVYLDIYEPYRKMSFRNRCIIAGAQGTISLSVPLQDGRNQNLPMKEVLISEIENWQSNHFKSIQSAYNRSPFFEYYQHELLEIYQKPFKRLMDWNLHCLNWVKEKLDWPAEIRFTENTIPFGAIGFEDRRNIILPKNYNQWNPVKYRQVFEERTGFLPNLSVLDLLFNVGKEGGELLRNSSIRV
ncbi:MAG TPA: WbqC family protein [Puia sp.]|nr:WbqC family protein [Puia sp.]